MPNTPQGNSFPCTDYTHPRCNLGRKSLENANLSERYLARCFQLLQSISPLLSLTNSLHCHLRHGTYGFHGDFSLLHSHDLHTKRTLYRKSQWKLQSSANSWCKLGLSPVRNDSNTIPKQRYIRFTALFQESVFLKLAIDWLDSRTFEKSLLSSEY